jgi:hypothetical protein
LNKNKNKKEEEKEKGKNMLNPETFSYKPVCRAFPFLKSAQLSMKCSNENKQRYRRIHQTENTHI